MTGRGLRLFDDPTPPEPPAERLHPGQPARSWRRNGPGSSWWVVDCADGRRAVTGGGSTRVRFFGGEKP